MSTPVEPTPTSIEGIEKRVAQLETNAVSFVQSKWSQARTLAYEGLHHVETVAKSVAWSGLAALAWKLAQHVF